MGKLPEPGDVTGIVADAWAAALGRKVPDKGHSFFAEGGDSLRAMDLLARLQERLAIRIGLRELLECRGLESLTALILARFGAGKAGSARLPPLPPASAGDSFSFAQERLAFMHELSSSTAAYHITQACRLQGALRTDVLQAAFDALAARHEGLRLAAVMDQRGLRGRPGSARLPAWREMDLRNKPPDSASGLSLSELLCELSNAPFDLRRGPLLRATLVRVAEAEYVLLLVAHHVTLDQWAMDVLLQDMADGYRRAIDGGPVQLPGTPLRFADFAHWQRRWFRQERQAVELAHWTSHLADLQPLALTEDYTRPAQQSFHGATLRFDLGLRDILALRNLGASCDASLAMTMLAAFNVLLARHTGRTDIAVGVPVAGRHLPHSRDLVGALLNTLVIRADTAPKQDFRVTLKNVRDAMITALEHQDLPFDSLVQALRLQRDPSRTPLFSVMFNMLNTPFAGMAMPGIEWSRLAFDKRAAQFDLQVTVDAQHSRAIFFEYATDVFAESTVQRLGQQYLALLKAIVQAGDNPIDLHASITDSEIAKLREHSQGPRIARAGGTLPALLAPVLEQHAASVAVRCGEVVMTYAELARCIRIVAEALCRRGVRAGDRVGLCTERSAGMLVGMLAILETGAAYVPLDPGYPADRLAYMARDSGMSLLLHDDGLRDDVAWPELRHGMLRISTALSEPPSPASVPPGQVAHPTDPAYVIYTSGSTGQPKGVVVPHGAVVNFLCSMVLEPGMTSSDRMLAVTTLSFDIAVLELLLPLYAGAEVVIAQSSEQQDDHALRRLLERHAITVMQATPSTWRMLLQSGWEGSRQLRVLVGGETLTRELTAGLLERCGQLWNMYGPTETTVWSTCYRVDSADRARIPVGHPIANTLVLILDADGALCPIEVPGEIYIGGDGVATGYLGQDGLTAERFIDNPHSRDRRTSRLYRTGDRGRFRADGLIEHLGRIDAQIKVRGHRIEPGEVEATLRAMDGVRDAAVMGFEAQAGDTRLAAYAVLSRPHLSVPAIRQHLRQWLPDYMLPQYVMVVDEIPRLPNGKTDRSRLPRPHADSGTMSALAPRDGAERKLWDIWREALGTDAFGVRDNFFEIGGHSLLAAQIANRIRETLAVGCSLPMIFRNPTIESLRAALESSDLLPTVALLPLNTAVGVPNLYCLCGLHLYQELADALSARARVVGVYVPEESDILGRESSRPVAPRSVERLAAEYVAALRGHHSGGTYHLCGFSFGGVVAFEVARQLRAGGDRVGALWILDSDVPGPAQARALHSLKSAVKRLTGVTAAPPDLDHYLDVMRRYEPVPTDLRILLVRSSEPPTYESGRSWRKLAPAADVIEISCDHLGVLREAGISAWLPAAELRFPEFRP